METIPTPLEGVEQEGTQPQRHAEHPHRVGRADVPAPHRPQIHSTEPAAHDKAEGHRAQQVGDHDAPRQAGRICEAEDFHLSGQAG